MHKALSKQVKMLMNLLNEYAQLISDGKLTLSFFYMRKIREVSWCKNKVVYLKTSFSFCLKTARKPGNFG